MGLNGEFFLSKMCWRIRCHLQCLFPFRSVGDKTEKQLGEVAEEEDVCQGEVAAKEASRASVIQCSCQPDCIPFINLCVLLQKALRF